MEDWVCMASWGRKIFLQPFKYAAALARMKPFLKRKRNPPLEVGNLAQGKKYGEIKRDLDVFALSACQETHSSHDFHDTNLTLGIEIKGKILLTRN